MSQNSLVVPNSGGATFRSNLNNGLNTLVTLNSGASAPSTTYAFMLWYDTTTGSLKIRNAANTAWIVVGQGSSRVLGCDCKNNATTPNTQFDLDADAVVLRDANNQTIVIHNLGAAITCNVSTAGPAANGRDQAGAFSASSWIHFYWIYDLATATLATIASAVAPPTGPTLPSGSTFWAYAGAVYFSGSSTLVKVRIKGSWARYEGQLGVLASGSAIAETAVSTATAVPPNALAVECDWIITANMNSGSDYVGIVQVRVVSGTPFEVLQLYYLGLGAAHGYGWPGTFIMPNISQNFYYLWSAAASLTSQAFTVYAKAYHVPNGGE